eukprot:6202343-Pleurochrysis_carterae.AAC.3
MRVRVHMRGRADLRSRRSTLVNNQGSVQIQDKERCQPTQNQAVILSRESTIRVKRAGTQKRSLQQNRETDAANA